MPSYLLPQATTGIGRCGSLFGLFILIRAGSSVPGAPSPGHLATVAGRTTDNRQDHSTSPGAAEDFGFTCIAGLRASKGRGCESRYSTAH